MRRQARSRSEARRRIRNSPDIRERRQCLKSGPNLESVRRLLSRELVLQRQGEFYRLDAPGETGKAYFQTPTAVCSDYGNGTTANRLLLQRNNQSRRN